MKNFDSVFWLCLFEPLEFYWSSREDDIGQMGAVTIDCHTGSFYCIFHHFGENFGRQILALVSNVVLEGFQGLGLVHVNTGLQKTPQKKVSSNRQNER